jgi:opacity protein-like surface antigen
MKTSFILMTQGDFKMNFKNMNFKKSLLLAAIVGLSFSVSAEASSREKKKIGIGAGFLSEPVPSIMSYHLKFNAMKWLQIGGGYGKVGSNLTSYGVNAKAFLMPSWNFTPYVGGGFTYAKVSGDFTINGETVGTLDEKANVIYASAGLDHQSNLGFNIGAGANFIFSPTELKDVLPFVPHVYFAWFF